MWFNKVKSFSLDNSVYKYFTLLHNLSGKRGSTNDIVIQVMDYDIVVSEFEL